MSACACRIAGPLGIGAVLGEAPVVKIGEAYYSVARCPMHEAAPAMLQALHSMTWRLPDDVCPNACKHRDCEAVKIGRDAIAKATA